MERIRVHNCATGEIVDRDLTSEELVKVEEFRAAFVSDPRIVQDEIERQACKVDPAIMQLVNQTKAEWLTWAGVNFPTLTAAERTRLGNLFWVVAVGVRRSVRNGG
jgi:hypothetical protein